jgi:DNA-binding response OmpR family regulator
VEEKKRVLLVEDDETLRYTISLVLKRRNFEIKEVESGEEALNIIEKEKFDYLISDVELPGIDGLNLAEKVKEKNLFNKIILMTALPSGEKLEMAEKLKLKIFVKPFEIEKIVSYLNGGGEKF